MPDTTDNAGCWKGVGVISRTLVRQVPQDWDPAISRSSRAMVFTTLVDDLWLTGGVVYGEPDSKLYPSRLANTEAYFKPLSRQWAIFPLGPGL